MTLETLYAQKAAGNTIYDKAKNAFMTEAAWLDYMRKTYDECGPDCDFTEWCDDSDFVDIDNMICALESL